MVAFVVPSQAAEDHTGHDHSTHDSHTSHDGHSNHAGHDHATHDDEKHADHVDHSAHGYGEPDTHGAHDPHEGHGHDTQAGDDAHEGHDHGEHEDVVQVSEEVLREFDIQIEPVASAELHQTVILPGEIQFNREAFASVTPRYAGVVLTIEKRLADSVEKGDVLATLENTETLRPFKLVAPINGTIVDYDLSVGQAIDAGAKLFAVADLSTVWADLRIYQRDLYKVKVGQAIRVECGYDDAFYAGKIGYIAPTIDEHTRTGLVRVVMDNADGHWKPGQFIKGIVSIDSHGGALVVPRSAVLTYEGKQVVFVRDADGFEPRAIRLGHSDAESYEVLEGLERGEVIVTRNAISLKAELGKASFGGHEGHVH